MVNLSWLDSDDGRAEIGVKVQVGRLHPTKIDNAGRAAADLYQRTIGNTRLNANEDVAIGFNSHLPESYRLACEFRSRCCQCRGEGRAFGGNHMERERGLRGPLVG